MKGLFTKIFIICISLAISFQTVIAKRYHVENKNSISYPQQSIDITGLWQDEDGTNYHISRKVDRVYMLIDRLPDYLRSFYGTVEGNIIRGSWADLPGAQGNGSGFVSFRIEDSNSLIVIASSGDIFYGSNLSKKVENPLAGGLAGTTGTLAAVAGVTGGTQASGGITGTWIWGNGAPVSVNADGTMVAGSIKGTWNRTGSSTYTFKWDNGFTDTMTLSADGQSMSGKNNNGSSVSARRSGGDSSGSGVAGTNTAIATQAGTAERTQSGEGIPGKWVWGNGAIVTVNADGTVVAGSVQGTWNRTGNNTYIFKWNNGFSDTMTLSFDGQSMTGRNNNGSSVSARRSGSGASGGLTEGTISNSAAGADIAGGRLEGAQDLVGIWTWGNNVKVTISADGRLDGGNVQGKWRLVDRAKKIYTFEWDNGFTDTMTLWEDNNKLNGINDRQSKVSARRAGFEDEGVYSGGEEIAGTWKWHNGATVVITADGRMDAGGVQGKWSLINPSSRTYRLKWYNGFTDIMSLLNRGNKLDGKNSGGSKVWGDRISTGDIRKPWETQEGQACFEEYIREVERRINSYDGGPEHNGRKPWYINQWGVLNSKTAYGASSDRAPDDFGKYDNRYHYMWNFWHRTGRMWGKAYLDESGVPDIWEYVDECLRRMAGN